MRKLGCRYLSLAVIMLAACTRDEAPPSNANDSSGVLPEKPVDPIDGTNTTHDTGGEGGSNTAPPQRPPACDATSPRFSSSSSSSSPPPIEIVVTPDDGDARVLALVASAVTSIDITIYQLTSYRVIDALKAASARGVVVRIIWDRREASSKGIADLRAAGMEVHTSSTDFTYTHQKTVLVDVKNASAAVAFVFSGNLDRLSFGSGRNFGVINTDADDIADLDELFDADWTARSPKLDCTRLVVAPINARMRILDLIASAKTSLDVEAMYVTDSDVEDAIAAAKSRGVAVRVLLNDPSHDLGDSTTAATHLGALAIPVRRSGALFIHAKLIVADQAHAFIGSENFSNNSLDHNREAGVIVSTTDGDISRIAQTFTSDWANGLPY